MNRIHLNATEYPAHLFSNSVYRGFNQIRLTEALQIELFDGRLLQLPAYYMMTSEAGPSHQLARIRFRALNPRTSLAILAHDYLYKNWEAFACQFLNEPVDNYYEPIDIISPRRYADRVGLELMDRFYTSYIRNTYFYWLFRLVGNKEWAYYRTSFADKPHQK